MYVQFISFLEAIVSYAVEDVVFTTTKNFNTNIPFENVLK